MKTIFGLLFLLCTPAFAQFYTNLDNYGPATPYGCADTNVPTYSNGVLICGAGGGGGGGTGTVTTVTGVPANGFTFSISNPTTTPAITLSTSVTGLVKGNGTSLSAAVSGTDYSAGTSALATGILKSTTGTGVLSRAVPGTDYQLPLTFGAISSSTTGVTVGSGANSTVGPNVTVDVQNATTAQPGLLTAADWNTFNGRQPFITAGTTAQYYRGDKTFQTLDTSVVPENGNLYFTNARAQAAVSATPPLVDTAGVFSIPPADATDDGYLTQIDWSRFDHVSGSASTPTYYDATGLLNPIPGYDINTEFGWDVNQTVDVIASNFNNSNVNVVPTAPTVGIYRSIDVYTTVVDPTNTGIQIGTVGGGGGVNRQNLNLDHTASGIVGRLSLSNGFSNLGDGVGGTLGVFSTYTHGEHIFSGYSIDQYSAFGDFPQFDAGSTVNNLNAFVFNPTFNGTLTGFADPISVFPNFGATSNTAHYHAMELGGEGNTTGAVGDYLGVNLYLNNVTSTDYKLMNGFPTGVTATNLSLLNFGLNNSTIQNLTFANFNAGSTTAQNATGVNIDMSGVTSPNQKSALKTNDGATQLQSNWDTSILPQPGGEFQLNLIGGTYHVAAGFPITDGSFGFGNNLGPSLLIEDDVSVDSTGVGLGFSVNGLVNQTSVVAGKTLPDLNYMTAGAGIPPTSTGGNITSARMFRAIGFLPSGGTLNITNLYGLQVDPLMDAVGATNEWGVWVGATNADNWFKKNIVVGGTSMHPTNASVGLELSGTTQALLPSQLTTVQRDALTAVEGMVIQNTTTHTMQYYNGSAWVDTSSSHLNVVVKTTTYTAVANDVVRCDASGGTFTTTVPAAAANPGAQIKIKKVDVSPNACSFAGTGGDTVEFQASQNLTTQGDGVTLISDGVSEWDAF